MICAYPAIYVHAKLAYAEFVQDGGRQLKFRECYCDIPSQLYAVERQKYEIRYSIGKPNKSGKFEQFTKQFGPVARIATVNSENI